MTIKIQVPKEKTKVIEQIKKALGENNRDNR